MKTLDEALAAVLDAAKTLGVERVPLEQAGGRVLAESILSDLDMPSFDVSAMDGFAFRAEDREKELRVVETIAAGYWPRVRIGEGECSRIMTGAALQSAYVSRDQVGEYIVSFTLTDAGSRIFSDYTAAHVGGYLAIVLDKQVISIPRIDEAITQGSGAISGSFTYDSANSLAIQLSYGALPIPLKIVDSKTVGPTLGQDSLRKSTIAGVIGLATIMLFMALYYRCLLYTSPSPRD